MSCKHVGGHAFTGVFDWGEIRDDALVLVVRGLITLDQVWHYVKWLPPPSL